MKLLPASITVGLAVALSACGGASTDAVVLQDSALPARTTPPAAVAPGTLGRIAEVTPAHTRIGYVNTEKLAAFGGPLGAAEIKRIVLGDGAARLDAATADAPKTAVQVGDATVLDGTSRTVVGGSAALRKELADPAPQVSLITDETPSAVQSCLADGPAEVIVGSAVLGRSAGIGVGLLDSDDAPAGPKLLICVAPHFSRQLDPTIARLRARFEDASLPAAKRPKIGEADIGERDIVTATIALDALDPSDVRALLSGGAALTKLIGS